MRKRTSRGLLFSLAILVLGLTADAALQFDKSEYAARRKNLIDRIPGGLAVIFGAQNVTGYTEYFQNNDMMYFSGVEIPNAVVLIDAVNKDSVLFFTISEREAQGENISLDLVRHPQEFTGIERCFPAENFSGYLARRIHEGVGTVYTSFLPEELMRECSEEKMRVLREDMIRSEWDGRLTRELQFVKLLRERFPQTEVKDCSGIIADLRSIKSPAEVEVLRRAGRIGVKAQVEIMKATRPGIFEYELAALFEYVCKKEGAQSLAYNVIMSSAENHPFLHYYKHNRRLVDGDFLVVDAGPDVGYYDVDITISYPANGVFTPRQREIYEACQVIEETCLSFYRPGITCEEVNEKVKETLAQKGYDLSKDVFKMMIRGGGCSHYVGMAVHDVGGAPRGPLKPGMVFACDILAVFPGEDMGVRVEDTVLITENGCENLTAGIPRKVAEIEALMKQKGMIQILKDNKSYLP
jgi:Xaa-Pro aminopeptidase